MRAVANRAPTAPGDVRPPLRLERPASFEGLRSEWNELATAGGNVFATWEWARVWWRHFGRGRPLLLTTCRAPDGRLVAVLPLYLASRRPLRIVRFLGNGPGDQLGPVCLPQDRDVAAACLRRVLDELRPDVFVGEQLLREEGWSARLAGRVLRTEGSPVLAFGVTSWQELTAGWSANRRQQIGKYERKLAREHGVRFRLWDRDGHLDAALDTLFELHRARFPASDFVTVHAAFHRDFAAVSRELGWLRLWLMEADGRTVAAWYGFRFAGVEAAYQTGRDPTWRGPGVGTALTVHSIRAALEDGMREYRFLRGGEPYKHHYANRDPGLETIAVSFGTLGAAALAAGVLAPRRLVRRLRTRLVG